MPRAKRTYIPGYVWHITHRCHNRDFLLKFERDRARWCYWLVQARVRYGLVVLNYIVTSNHIHLLVHDKKKASISRSLQLISGRVAQEYNRRKSRKGAFWEDRYFATAVSTDRHLIRCLVYIDLNMVRAGVVRHPSQWKASGYNEIQSPRQRYRTIDIESLVALAGAKTISEFQERHRSWVSKELESGRLSRQPEWTEAKAVGSDFFKSVFMSAKSSV